MAQETIVHHPTTAIEAMDVWDKGETLRAFRVTSEKATQEEIYAAAFEMIRSGKVAPAFGGLPKHDKLTQVEHASAHSIAFVAVRQGWAAMVQGHIHGNSPEILIKKPA